MPPGRTTGQRIPCFGGNVNEVLREGGAGGLFMRAEAAGEPTLDKPVAIYTAANLKALHEPPPDRPKNLTVKVLDDRAAARGQAERSGAHRHLAGGSGGGHPGAAAARGPGSGAGGRDAALLRQVHAAAGSLCLVDRRQAGRRGQPSGRTSCSRTSSTATTSGRSKGRPSAKSPRTARCPTRTRCPASSGQGLVNSYRGRG